MVGCVRGASKEVRDPRHPRSTRTPRDKAIESLDTKATQIPLNKRASRTPRDKCVTRTARDRSFTSSPQDTWAIHSSPDKSASHSLCDSKVTRSPRLSYPLLLLVLIYCFKLCMCGGSLGAALVCARAAGLTERQRQLCRADPAAIAVIADGLRMAYAECRVQMAGRRWNCSGVGDSHHFSHVMPLATREAAFTYAITSAGVTHALSAACARGDLPACRCSHRSRRSWSASTQWEWGGCGAGAWGGRMARRWLDARELERDARALMNLHNNRLGRKVVKDLVRRECKCHGVSGSCSARTCWRALPSLRDAAAALADKYARAKHVAAPNDRLVLVRRHKANSNLVRVPRKSELVYLTPSPSYCEADPGAGVLGTHHRHCNRTSRGEDGCGSLCCGRGYSTARGTAAQQCRCRFHWCCRVTCDTCRTHTETHVCN